MRRTIVAVTLMMLFLANYATAEPRVEKNVVYGMYSGLALLMDVHLSLLELFFVFSRLFVVSPSDNRINFAAHDRCFTIAMNSGSIAYKPAMIGSGLSR
jgi:hypothetical protein